MVYYNCYCSINQSCIIHQDLIKVIFHSSVSRSHIFIKYEWSVSFYIHLSLNNLNTVYMTSGMMRERYGGGGEAREDGMGLDMEGVTE